MTVRKLVGLVAAAGSLVTAGLLTIPVAPAEAGPPGTWTRISGSNPVSATASASLVRTADGVLHVAYPSQDGFGKNLVHAAVAADGTYTGGTTIHTGFDTMNGFPVLNRTASGLRVDYGAFIADPPGGPYSFGYVYGAASTTGGSTWSVFTGGTLQDSQGYASDGTGVAVLSDDTPVTAIARGSEIRYGAGEGVAPSSFSASRCCVYYATMVTDGVNAAVAWQGNGGSADSTGTFARQVYPGLGAIYKAPKSSTDTGTGHAASMSNEPTAAIQRNDGFTYLAYKVGYPTVTGVGLWRASAPSTVIVPGSKGARYVALAVAPTGRMWVAWTTESGKIKAVRTSASGLKFGGVRTIAKPGAASGLFGVYVEGSAPKADLVVNGGNGLFHTQVEPGLNFSASPKSWRTGTAQRVVFTVKDAGVAIRGAKVKAKGSSCTTSASGTCALTFAASGRTTVKATATKSSYAPATVSLKVR